MLAVMKSLGVDLVVRPHAPRYRKNSDAGVLTRSEIRDKLQKFKRIYALVRTRTRVFPVGNSLWCRGA